MNINSSKRNTSVQKTTVLQLLTSYELTTHKIVGLGGKIYYNPAQLTATNRIV